jgi:hypothetical protein
LNQKVRIMTAGHNLVGLVIRCASGLGVTMLLRLRFGALLLGAWGLTAAVSEAADRPTWSSHVEQWGIQELVLSSDKTYSNPFADVDVQAEFRAGKQIIKVAGFYDGTGRWKVRFMPPRPGVWSFKSTSHEPTLNAVKGRFTVDPPESDNHGPVKAFKTYHFAYADGTPFFLLGTTSYNWLNRDASLQERTLAALGQSGFTKVRFGLFPKWYEFNRVEPAVFPFVRKEDRTFALDRFDPSFFANVEKRIGQLQKMGIQADVILFHPYDHWGFANMDPAHNEAYLRYVVARLAAYRNVWWTMANEYDLMTPRDWNRLTQLVSDSDPYHHPVGNHNYGTWYDHSKHWIDHVILQDGGPQAARSATIARRRYQKPVVVDEYGYEGNNGNGWGELTGPQEVARHWEITMAGAYASHGETYVHPGGVLWWAAGGELEGESPVRLVFLKTVMTSLPFQDMVPAPELVVNGTALAKVGQAYLVRIPWNEEPMLPAPAQVKLEGADLFKVELIDPWRMRIYPLGYTAAGEQAFQLRMLPALLRITAVAKAEGTPEPINVLVSKLVGEEANDLRADPALFKVPALHYSADFQIGMLEHSPAAAAVLEKHLPHSLLLEHRWTAFPVTMLPMFLPDITEQQIEAIQAELATIPVE